MPCSFFCSFFQCNPSPRLARFVPGRCVGMAGVGHVGPPSFRGTPQRGVARGHARRALFGGVVPARQLVPRRCAGARHAVAARRAQGGPRGTQGARGSSKGSGRAASESAQGQRERE
jgi:hypothetical protein